MSPEEILKLIKAARAEFKSEMWGHDDDAAVDSYIIMLKRLLKKQLKATPVVPVRSMLNPWPLENPDGQ